MRDWLREWINPGGIITLFFLVIVGPLVVCTSTSTPSTGTKHFCEQAITCLDQIVKEENQSGAPDYTNIQVIRIKCDTKVVIAELETDVITEINRECMFNKVTTIIRVNFDPIEKTCPVEVISAKLKSRKKCN